MIFSRVFDGFSIFFGGSLVLSVGFSMVFSVLEPRSPVDRFLAALRAFQGTLPRRFCSRSPKAVFWRWESAWDGFPGVVQGDFFHVSPFGKHRHFRFFFHFF